MPSREVTITRSTWKAAGSTGAERRRQTRASGFGPAATRKTVVGEKKSVNPKKSSVASRAPLKPRMAPRPDSATSPLGEPSGS
ncbi:MAG TPA: hypothetical protein VFG23_24725 [Polyangia bacterium]|nr:hypothetical protein [Polyangia bacterium]